MRINKNKSIFKFSQEEGKMWSQAPGKGEEEEDEEIHVWEGYCT